MKLAHALVVLVVVACSSRSAPPGAEGASTTSPNEPGPTGSGGVSPNASTGRGAAPGLATCCGDAGDAAPTPVPFVPYDINHVLSTGQSNSVANGGVPVLDTTQPYANLMLSSGVIPATGCDAAGCTGYEHGTSFLPLVEGDTFFYPVETMSAPMANAITHLAKDRLGLPGHDVLVSLHGRSGNTYWCLRKGGCNYHPGYVVPFDDGMSEVSDALALARAAGKSYVVRAVTAIHGESDHYGYSRHTEEFPLPGTDGVSTIATYADGLLEWQRDYEASVRALTGQTEPVPLLISQMHLWTDVPTSEITEWQFEAHVASKGKVVLVTPAYHLPYAADCLHYTAEGQRWLGEYFAKAYARIVLEGLPWEPVRPKKVTLAGNVLTARFYVPKPPLVLDTTLVTDPGDRGFEVVVGGARVPIAGVAITAADTVTITLASAPAAAARLRYAFTAPIPGCPGPTTGVRGNLRDSDDTPSLYGNALYDWGVTFDVPVE